MKLSGADDSILQREKIDRAMMRINTAIPGEILSFDEDTQTATVRPAVKMRTYIDEIEEFVDYPQLLEVPIVFPFVSTAGFALTFPVRTGDPCLLVFSQRAIDNWHERGGVQPPEEGEGSRHHDLTDAFAIFAPAPLPEVLEYWEDEGMEIRNRARTSRVTVRDEEVEIQVNETKVVVNSDGEVEMTAPTKYSVISPTSEFSGTVTAVGRIESETEIKDPKGTMEGMRTIYNTHTHDGGATPDQLME